MTAPSVAQVTDGLPTASGEPQVGKTTAKDRAEIVDVLRRLCQLDATIVRAASFESAWIAMPVLHFAIVFLVLTSA